MKKWCNQEIVFAEKILPIGFVVAARAMLSMQKHEGHIDDCFSNIYLYFVNKCDKWSGKDGLLKKLTANLELIKKKD